MSGPSDDEIRNGERLAQATELIAAVVHNITANAIASVGASPATPAQLDVLWEQAARKTLGTVAVLVRKQLPDNPTTIR